MLPCAVAGHAGHHRQITVRRQQVEQLRIGARDAAHRAQRRIHLFGFHQAGVDAGESHGPRAGRDSAPPPVPDSRCPPTPSAPRPSSRAWSRAGRSRSGSRRRARPGSASSACRRRAPPRSRCPALDDGRDLGGQAVARLRRIEQRAAELDQHLHSRPSVSGKPSIRFMFCTAWPAAPFTRLSMALTTTRAARRRIERHADIAEIGARHGAQIGHVARADRGG